MSTPSTVVTPESIEVIGYVRVSTDEQVDSGLGLAAQRSAIEDECVRRGWKLLTIYEDAGMSGRNLKRPGLTNALATVKAGKAKALVVSKLDRLSRSLVDFAGLMASAQSQGWNLVALDLGIDLSAPAGEFMANVMASAAQWERRLIGQRTKDALAVKRAQGIRLGRPPVLAESLRKRVERLHRAGDSLSGIARQLNDEGVPTAHGGKRWYASTVRSLVQTA